MPHRIDPDPYLPLIVSAATARSAGLTGDQVRQRVRSGEWQRLARGWYLREPAAVVTSLSPTRLHQLHAVAAAQRIAGATVCGPSAALLHGLPLLRPPRDVHLIAAPGGWTGHRGGTRLHEWVLPPHHVDRAPVRLTTPERTWVDIARVGGWIEAVVAGDHLLRLQPEVAGRLVAVIDELAGGHLLGRALAALPLLDGRRESPLESSSACYFVRHRLPTPEWQVEIVDDEGFIGRVDCAWDDTHVVGEADGRLKYASADDLYREKRREDRLRATGRVVIRWGWADLRDERLALRIRAALGNSHP